MNNYNCDGNGDLKTSCTPGQVRILPIGSDPNHGNLILCQNHHAKEILWREARNREGVAENFLTPRWDELKVYGEDA